MDRIPHISFLRDQFVAFLRESWNLLPRYRLQLDKDDANPRVLLNERCSSVFETDGQPQCLSRPALLLFRQIGRRVCLLRWEGR